jgi:Rps23 Pro-64 3,4-dihydroxylase Tpa1-like proline 4-hydroxylase
LKSYDELKAESEAINTAIASSPYINEIDLMALRDNCRQAKPFCNVCIDGMWNEDFLEIIRNEVSEFSNWAGEKNFYGSKKKHWQADWDKMPKNTNSFLAYLNQPLILRIIEFLTEEVGLISDPYLEGGGIHSTGQDGFLKLHADFNWNEKLQLYRRINILVYLNKDWTKEYGGQIELAGKDASGEFNSQISLEPIFNRTLIFITDDHSFHGQPNPVKHPLNKTRDSIAAYYYISKKPEGTSGVKRTGTDYKDSKGLELRPSLFIRGLKKFKNLIR